MADFIIVSIIVVISGAVIRKIIKDKREGKSSCGCGCSNCKSNGKCH